jgi:ABC-type transporter Mla maintaining outer membrane lipid asymmetry ATPase subunit MlaF
MIKKNIHVVVLGIDYNNEELLNFSMDKELILFPEAGLHPVKQIEFCRKIKAKKNDVVVATYSTYILEYFEIISDNIYILDEKIIKIKRLMEAYNALSKEAYNIIDHIKFNNFFNIKTED